MRYLVLAKKRVLQEQQGRSAVLAVQKCSLDPLGDLVHDISW